MRSIDETESTWALFGPLGLRGRNRQRGRSVTLGGTTRSNPNPTRATLVNVGMRGSDEDALASCMTVSLGASAQSDPNNPQFVQAQLLWGTDGHQHEATVDVTPGTVVQVSAAYVRVNAYLVPLLNDNQVVPALPEGSVVVGATIGYGSCGRFSTRYTEQFVLDDGASLIRPVPAFAHSFGAVSTFAKSVDWLTSAAVGAIIGTSSFDSTNPEMPVPGCASHIQWNGTPGATYTVCWNLYI